MQAVNDASQCITTPPRASRAVDSPPLTPGHIEDRQPVVPLPANAYPPTPPSTSPCTPQSSRSGQDAAEPPRKRRCLERVAQEGQGSRDEAKFDHAYVDLFLTEHHDHEASDWLNVEGSTESTQSTQSSDSGQYDFQNYISDLATDETGRAEVNEAGFILAHKGEKTESRPVNSSGLEPPDTEVCFGMIGPIAVNLDGYQTSFPGTRTHISEGLKVSVDGTVCLEVNGTAIGSIVQRMGEILHVLGQYDEIRLQVRTIFKAVYGSKNRQNRVDDCQRSASFFAIVYGPFGASETIGDFLEKYDVYLQTPRGCGSNRRYRNPHALSGRDLNAPYTYDLDLVGQRAQLRAWEGSSNYLDGMEFPEGFAEADTPGAVSTRLFKHQRQGLYFMQQRERGWMLKGDMKADIWEQFLCSGVPIYRNTINDEEQPDPPPTFRGGILADEMGLGKTLTVAALIASDRDVARQPSLVASDHAQTLIIVPPALLDTWDTELKKHYSSGKMHWARHHRTQRFTQLSQLGPLDIVLTTYNTVEREWQVRHQSASVLFLAHWHRIVLDEAHLIRNNQTKTAEAICELHADRRWAVTGTPIQNHVTDFVALLQFLRVAPYDQPAKFDNDIVQVWKDDPEAAVSRLKRLIICIGVRRTRRNIELPPCQAYDRLLRLNTAERQMYDQVQAEVNNMAFQHSLSQESKGRFIHALQGLNTLRLICNFGTLTNLKGFACHQQTCLQWGPEEAQKAFNTLLSMGATKCTHCRADTAVSKEASLDMLELTTAWDQQRLPEISRCGQVICGSCALSMSNDGLESNWCGHQPLCTTHPVSTKETAIELSPSARDPNDVNEWPTKIRALIDDLKQHPQSKSVVFSDWRTTLDIAARALDFCSIPYVRYDGTVLEKGRVSALNQFSKDARIKVILFTIRCGAVGLDLTAADRAYLMEPQWNPTVEAQAFARIHRMGQTKPVTTIRFVIEESYEQQVVMVQGRKKNFADMVLSPKKSPSSARGSFDQLKALLV
ncbi:hypothetical protein DV737_g5352, partial [Chaetothyriales sp. CBS 132003]